MRTMISPILNPTWSMAPEDGAGGGAGGAGAAGGAGDAGDGGGEGAAGAGAAGAGEGEAAPWYAGLSDELKAQPGVVRHKSLEDAVLAGIAAEKRLGVPADQLLRLPTKPEEIGEFAKTVYKHLGAPDTPEGYKVDLEGASDADKAVLAEFLKDMHAAGPFPPDMLAAVSKWWHGRVQAEAAAETAEAEAASAKAEGELKTEFGAKYDQTLKEVGALVAQIGGQALVDELDLNGKVGSSPALFRFLAKINDKMAEPGPTGDGQRAKAGDGKMTPAEAKVARATLEGDPVEGMALRDPRHPMHAAVVEKRNRLLAFENPQPA